MGSSVFCQTAEPGQKLTPKRPGMAKIGSFLEMSLNGKPMTADQVIAGVNAVTRGDVVRAASRVKPDTIFEDPDNGWRAIAGDRLRSHAIPGNHDTLIEGDGAVEMARWLSFYLSEESPLSGTAADAPRADTAGERPRPAS